MRMMSSEWMECVRWCHAGQSNDSVEQFVENLVDLERRSTYPQTILTESLIEETRRVAGYIILYPGGSRIRWELAIPVGRGGKR